MANPANSDAGSAPSAFASAGERTYFLAYQDGRSGLLRTGASRAQALNLLYAAAADVFAIACTDAVLSARSTRAHRAYRDLCPSAYRSIP